MLRIFTLALLFCLAAACSSLAQAPATTPATVVWNALAAPTMDPTKAAHVENLQIVRDRVHITLKDGTIQFTQPVSGKVTGAAFHGTGILQLDPPNATEAQQLQLFTKQSKLDAAFSDATFSFTDGLYDEIAKNVKWGTAAGGDDLYAKRQQIREDLGESLLPRLFEGVISPDPAGAAVFLADLKTSEKGWVEVSYDAEDPEEVSLGRWVDAGPVRRFDVWTSFPAGDRDPHRVFEDPASRQIFPGPLLPDLSDRRGQRGTLRNGAPHSYASSDWGACAAFQSGF